MPGDQTRSSSPKGGSAHRDDQTRSNSPAGGSAPKKISFGQDLSWRLEAAAFKALFAFLRALGVEGASGFGGKLLRWLGPLTGTHKTVTRNLRIAFPDMDRAERDRLAVDQWEQTGRTFAELAVMDRLTPESGRIDIVD